MQTGISEAFSHSEADTTALTAALAHRIPAIETSPLPD